jgi:hypothetical protein
VRDGEVDGPRQGLRQPGATIENFEEAMFHGKTSRMFHGEAGLIDLVVMAVTVSVIAMRPASGASAVPDRQGVRDATPATTFRSPSTGPRVMAAAYRAAHGR